MPLRRPPDPPPSAPPASPPPASSTPADPLTEPRPATAPPSPEPEPAPSPSQLRTAAQELAQAAERTERSAREILGRAHTLCESLARSLDASERRSTRETFAVLLITLALSAGVTVLATLVVLSVLNPRWSVLALLRTLLHAG